MSPQQAIRQKEKSFPWAVDWLQRYSEKAIATRGQQQQLEGSTQQWEIQAAWLCHPPPYVVINPRQHSLCRSQPCLSQLSRSNFLALAAWGTCLGWQTCYCSLCLGGFDSVFYTLASTIAWHTLRHPHTAVRYNAAPTGDLCLSEVAARARQECPRAP